MYLHSFHCLHIFNLFYMTYIYSRQRKHEQHFYGYIQSVSVVQQRCLSDGRSICNPLGPLLTFNMTKPPHNSQFGVEEFDWSAQRPDLSPIQHLWDKLERRLRALSPNISVGSH